MSPAAAVDTLPADPDAFGPGLYVHIPFCAHKCFYCDFTAYFHRPARVERYLDALGRELDLRSAMPDVGDAVFRTVFIGGGTPSILASGRLTGLLAHLRRRFRIDPAAEVTVEANPGDLTPERLEALALGGVNRLSIGVQARQPRLLAALGRDHGWDDVVAGLAVARRAGFTDISMDLMFGLPGQTLADWRETLAAVLDLGPEHLSAYGLEIEEHTSYGRWHREGRLRLPPDHLQAEMMAVLEETTAAAGLGHYEISNFARPGHRSRHNLNYWANGFYLGLGAGAWSHWAGERSGNLRHLRPYGEAAAAGRLPVAEVDTPEPRTRMAEAVMLGTRLVEGMPTAWFRRRFGREAEQVFAEEIQELKGRGWLDHDGGRLRLTPAGRLLANDVWATFL